MTRVPHGPAGLHTLPTTGRLLGVDLGDVRVGLAITDAGQLVATPLETRPALDGVDEQADDLVGVTEEHDVAGVVLGYPRTLQGREGPPAARARRVATALAERTPMPVVLWDERFTTVEAERVMLEQDASRRERRAHIDRVAATLILQGVVESRRGGGAWR
jgi:putative Holliday junction resolvase